MGRERIPGIWKVGTWYLFILVVFTAYSNWLPQSRGEVLPEPLGVVDVADATPQEMARIGKLLVFGTSDPNVVGGEAPIGKGQCPLCHLFFDRQRYTRCPDLPGIVLLSESRIKEDRYKMFAEKYASVAEPDSGIKPHAKSGGEYLIESLYCPSCYVAEGSGYNHSTRSAEPIINKPPISLTDNEIVAVVAYLQFWDTGGNISKVTAKQDWESYFGEKLTISSQRPSTDVFPNSIALSTDTPGEIVRKMGCFACHKIPSLGFADSGVIGPLLIEKTNAPRRIASPEYQEAVRRGKAHATTPKEYVMESIIHPEAFVVPGFVDDMIKDYGNKFTGSALEKLADFLLTLDEETARKEGLDRLPNEREGSLYSKQR